MIQKELDGNSGFLKFGVLNVWKTTAFNLDKINHYFPPKMLILLLESKQLFSVISQ